MFFFLFFDNICEVYFTFEKEGERGKKRFSVVKQFLSGVLF